MDSGFTRFNAIVTSLKSLDLDYSSKNHVRKFFRALPLKWRAKVKSLALKAKVTKEQPSDDSDSQDGTDEDIDEEEEAESFNLLARNFCKFFSKGNQFGRGNRFGNGANRFGKCHGNTFGNKGGESSKPKGACYNCGIEGHFASECRKPKENKAFTGGAWSNSEDDDEHQNDATCLMVIDFKEVKSLALKAKVTKEQPSDDSDSQDGSDEDIDEEEEAEAFNLLARNFRKFFSKGNQFGRGNRFGNGANRFGKGHGKEIAKPITPPYESTSEEDNDPEQAQRDKDMQKNMALITKYFKKINKPTNNNLRTSSNTRNKNMDTSNRYKNENLTSRFRNQRTVTVVGARETETKRVKDYTYYKEKMLLCKQAKKGVPLQAEQADWLEDTDKEIDEQELEVHYSY
nr:hypothetical protein [Tanacetum cinerariifolium]